MAYPSAPPAGIERKRGLPAVGGSRQGYAKALRIQRAFASFGTGSADGSVRDKSLCARSTVVRADSISSRSCEISRRVVSINARVLVMRSRCSESIGLAPEGFRSSAATTCPGTRLHNRVGRLNTTDETGIWFRMLWPRISKAIALAGEIDLHGERNLALTVRRLLDRQEHSKRREATERRLERALDAYEAPCNAFADEAPGLEA